MKEKTIGSPWFRIKRNVPWSFLAVKIINPVSSPTKHSAIRIWRTWGPSARPFCNTILVLTTFTVSVCPLVPGRSWSTLVNVGFLNPGFDSAIFDKPKKPQNNKLFSKTTIRNNAATCMAPNKQKWLLQTVLNLVFLNFLVKKTTLIWSQLPIYGSSEKIKKTHYVYSRC